MLKYIVVFVWMIIVWTVSIIVTIVEFAVRLFYKVTFNWRYRIEMTVSNQVRGWVGDNYRKATEWLHF